MLIRKITNWYHTKVCVWKKVVIALAALQGIVLLFFGVYSYSLTDLILTETTKGQEPGRKAELLARFNPGIVSCLIIAFVLYCISLLTSYFLAKILGDRISKLARQADAIATGDLTGISKTDATDEIGVLTNSISEMAICLNDKAEEAKLANTAKSSFLTRMSHDIRTPLNAIKGMVEIVRKNPNDIPRIMDCLKKIEVSSNHLIVLIDEILDMSKLESGEVEITNEQFDLGEAIDECYELASSQAGERDVFVFLDRSELEHTKVCGCELYLKRVITNILANGIKFNKDQGSVTMEVTENVIDKRRAVFQFVIEDTGIGMTKEFVSHAFDPFTQEEKGARTNFSGTGLGLPIVKMLLERMGGKISLVSEYGQGSRFTFTIPLILDSSSDSSVEERAETESGNLSEAHMLVVEDNELNLEIAKYMLEDWGISVDTATNGLEAVRLFETNAPFTYDLILMDVMMPELDGIEATKRIRIMNRADAKLVPIVALSAKAYAEDIKASKDAGMNDHVTKPLDVKKLKEVIIRQKKLYDAKRVERPYSQLFTGDALK